MTQRELPFTKKRQRRRPSALEHDEQVALFRWWAMTPWAHQGILMFAIPNGGARDIITAARLKAEGVLAGIPDIFLACQKGPLGGLFIELKREHGGRLTEVQKAALSRLSEANFGVVVAHGWREAKDAIENYMEQKHCGEI